MTTKFNIRDVTREKNFCFPTLSFLKFLDFIDISEISSYDERKVKNVSYLN